VNAFNVTFGDMPDPENRYSSPRDNQAYRRYQMCIPLVFDIDNNLINPLSYHDAIPDGTLVFVRAKMKMYVLRFTVFVYFELSDLLFYSLQVQHSFT
jgi:hypothetical protein